MYCFEDTIRTQLRFQRLVEVIQLTEIEALSLVVVVVAVVVFALPLLVLVVDPESRVSIFAPSPALFLWLLPLS